MATTFNFTRNTNGNTVALETIMANAREIGRKTFATIPLKLLMVDQRFQRADSASESKINQLVRNFDINKMDAIKVSPHFDTGLFSVLDGYHRVRASEILEEKYIEAEILTNLPTDPAERLMAEARIFSTQNQDVDKLTPMQKHRANVLLGDKANVILQQILDKYNVELCIGCMHKTGKLSGFTDALAIAERGGYQMLDDVFYIIHAAKWNLNPYGMTKITLNALYRILKMHSDARETIRTDFVEKARELTPRYFRKEGAKKYSLRTPYEQFTLALEDFLHDNYGMPLLYLNEAREAEEDAAA